MLLYESFEIFYSNLSVSVLIISFSKLVLYFTPVASYDLFQGCPFVVIVISGFIPSLRSFDLKY